MPQIIETEQTKTIIVTPKKPEATILVDSPTKVEIVSVPASSPGPRGKNWEWEDFTPEMIEEITGPAGTIEIGTVTTGEEGSQATITNVGTDKHAVLDFSIPKGDTGEKGTDGDAATIQVGTVSTVPYPAQATVLNGGDTTHAVFNFTLPQGPRGYQGDAGNVQDVKVSYDAGQTWHSAMSGNIAEIVMSSGTGSGELNKINIIKKNGTALPIENKTVDINVPIATSELINDSGFITANGIPIASISIDGIPQTITNKNVDLPAIPTADIYPAPSTYTKAYYAVNADQAGTAMYMDLAGLQSARDLQAIEALQGTNGLLKKTGENTWTLDTNTYITANDVLQSNWNESDTTSKAYIQNKPQLPTMSSVNQGWVAYADFSAEANHAFEASTADWASNVNLSNVTNADDLKAIEALSGTNGLLKKTAANTWTLDTTQYITANDVPQSDWNETDTSSKAYIQNKPTQLSAFTDNLGSHPVHTHSQYAESSSLASVATSGSYTDLSNKPTKVSNFTNDAGYITSSDVPIESISVNGTAQTITNKNVDISVPTTTNELTNDSGFITIGDVPQSNWNETNTSSKAYIKNKPTNLSQFTDNLGTRPIHTHSQYALDSQISAVGKSGSYIDLINKPTNVSYFTNDAGYITQSNVPIESISVNGTTQPISNKKVDVDIPLTSVKVNGATQTITNRAVDISVPTHGQIANGNTGYVNGNDVYQYVPRSIIIDAYNDGTPITRYDVPSMNIGESRTYIFNDNGVNPTSTIHVIKNISLVFDIDTSRYYNGYEINYYVFGYESAGTYPANPIHQHTESDLVFNSGSGSSTRNRFSLSISSSGSSYTAHPYFFKVEITRVS